MQSAVLKRSIVIDGQKTSVSLEDAFWNGLKEIAVERRMPLQQLVSAIDAQRQHGNLSSAIRLFVLDFYRAQLSGAKEGHDRTHEITAHTMHARSSNRLVDNGKPRQSKQGECVVRAFPAPLSLVDDDAGATETISMGHSKENGQGKILYFG